MSIATMHRHTQLGFVISESIENNIELVFKWESIASEWLESIGNSEY